jgi:NADH:ubiquinone oxidoreductase subunit B-like Fe-S oxidoreductase
LKGHTPYPKGGGNSKPAKPYLFDPIRHVLFW